MMIPTVIPSRKYLLVIAIGIAVLASLGLVFANTDMARAEHECHHAGTACDGESCYEHSQGSHQGSMEEMHLEMHG